VLFFTYLNNYFPTLTKIVASKIGNKKVDIHAPSISLSSVNSSRLKHARQVLAFKAGDGQGLQGSWMQAVLQVSLRCLLLLMMMMMMMIMMMMSMMMMIMLLLLLMMMMMIVMFKVFFPGDWSF
jgi:hypothetical protein